MPASQPCPTPGCPELKPCPTHTPTPWAGSTRPGSTRRTRAIRAAVLRRDGHRCQRCGATGVPLEAAHITPDAEGGSYTPDNLRALCVPCHKLETAADAARGRERGRIGRT